MRTVVAVAVVSLATIGAFAVPVRIDVRTGESLATVRDRVRELSERERADGVEVVFAPGQYQLSGTLRLDAKDGGRASGKPVVWRAERPGTVHFTSARTVPADRFRNVTDPDVLKSLPPENRGDTLVADVSDLLPAEIPAVEVFLNGDFATQARWPNAGEFTSFTGRVDVGRRDGNGSYLNGAFVYSNPRAKRWNFAKGVRLYGYWTHDWSSCDATSYSYGAENGTNDVIRLATPVVYGINAGTHGGVKRRRFYVYGMLEELDAPREWWLDRTSRKLYLVPEPGGLKPSDVVRLAPKAPVAIDANGLANFRFEGLSVGDHYGPGLALVRSHDVEVVGCSFVGIGGTPAVRLVDSKRCRVADCTLRHLAGFGIVLRGGDRLKLERADCTVENCRILDFGVKVRTYQGAVEVQGCGHTVRNSEFAYAPHQAMRFESNETLIENNDIHHVLLETDDAGAIYTGRDCTTQGNVIRHNFIHELGVLDGANTTVAIYFDDCDCGDAVYGNVIWKCARGILVGGGRDHPISGNVFAECRIGISLDHRGWTSPDFYRRPGKSGHFQPARMAKMKVTEEPWKLRYPHLANQMNDGPEHPYYDPVTSNVFLDCSSALVKLDGSLRDDILARMTFADNLAIATPRMVKPLKMDKRLAPAFEVRTNATETGFVDASAGDFRLAPNSPIKAKLPALDLGPRWR